MKPAHLFLPGAAAIALLAVVALGRLGPAVAQTPGAPAACSPAPCLVPNLFDLDLADLKPNGDLQNPAQWALDSHCTFTHKWSTVQAAAAQ